MTNVKHERPVQQSATFKAMYGEYEIERIPTGLTANYVPYWTVVQGLKEAMQNIAYGSIKSEKPAKLYFDTKANMWAIRDKYTGFEKRHLYIGESEQRNDEDGLGAFGEGWKIFLLVMARNNIVHKVSTVGFSFQGVMEPTPHGTEVLNIIIKPNTQTVGTTVYADVEEELWKRASESFAVLNGIDHEYIKKDCIIPDRANELWVSGVRIEHEDNSNPLNLYYAYNLNQRKLINRDRSHVNVSYAQEGIKSIIFKLDEAGIKEYVSLALEGKQNEDIVQGPWVPYAGHSEQKLLWLEILADLHATEKEKLLIPSYNQAVNGEAKKQGYTLLDTPRKWDYEIQYLGIRKADDVIDDRYDVVEQESYGVSEKAKTSLAKAKNKIKKAFKLASVKDLPQINYVAEINNPVNSGKKSAYYDSTLGVLYITTDILHDEKLIIQNILPELMGWKYHCKTTEQFEQVYKEIVLNLMGL